MELSKELVEQIAQAVAQVLSDGEANEPGAKPEVVTSRVASRKPLADAVGGKIREARQAAGMGRGRFAAAIDRSEFSVRNWETGASVPDLSALMRIGLQLGRRVEDFVPADYSVALSAERRGRMLP